VRNRSRPAKRALLHDMPKELEVLQAKATDQGGAQHLYNDLESKNIKI
jgi:hypothetical protein